ncbi:hypothetical protein MSAN_00837400 [Mycena sanguinolenta]|uniref:Cytochrome P450 n=1 Tax=Mycena sanguinolenta TaxID=230812 RepID=A0A8H7DAW8_9AGAR|nr:hypothetical protein MSAN_00837400 [Mycena sanguinolenta]
MDDQKFLLLYGVLAGVLVASFRMAVYDRKVANVPIVGSSGLLASCWDGFRFIHHGPEIIQRGYDMYPEGMFRVARLFRWEYVVCGQKLIKDIASASKHAVSFAEGIEEARDIYFTSSRPSLFLRPQSVQTRFTMGREIAENDYYLDVVRTTLTRNLDKCFPDVGDEIICAFDEVLELQGSEWKSHPVLPKMMAIVARVSSRLFVGLPLCRDKAYLANNVSYTIDVFRSANKITLFSPFLRPQDLCSLDLQQEQEQCQGHGNFRSTYRRETSQRSRVGSRLAWETGENDFLSWMLNVAEGDQRAVLPLTLRILSVNMAAIHTSSRAFAHALFDLTTHPEYLLPMREEAERVVAEEGWSKAALDSMVKIDSFLRESQRLNTSGSLVMKRKVIAKEGFRFSDGTVLPCGSYLAVAARATHYDESKYENAAKFDGFRFSRERAEPQANNRSDDSQDVFKRQMISTAVDYLTFGTGKHACPVNGRFFAATELKAMMAHLVLHYDVKPEGEGVRPADTIFGQRFSPNPAGRVYFRKRQ